jgi:alkaline phosphatase
MQMQIPRLAALAAGLIGLGAVAAPAPAQVRTGNVVFLHPDGTGVNHWDAGRTYWEGPDGFLAWDDLEAKALYRGSMADRLVGTSNGGATTHAFGFKVAGAGSFGRDGSGEASRSINALSGYPGSIMREAANRGGFEVGVVNDGTLPEPGTGAFLAEVGNRNAFEEIALQMLEGRPGADDKPVRVLLGGGERHFLPEGVEGVHGPGTRTDGRDLIEEAEDDGYLVVRTRQEFERVEQRMRRNPRFSPKILGLFASFHTFNDTNEEDLIANGFVDPSIPAGDKRSNLILYGSKPGTPGYDPPTVAEMSAMAAEILDRRAKRRGTSWFLVAEPESTDNFGNENNAIGSLTAVKRSDDVIRELRRYTDRGDTLLFTAADSDASGLQIVDQGGETTGTVNDNPAAGQPDVEVPVDGLYGRGTVPFRAAPDQFGQQLPFGVVWAGPDVRGGILSKAAGLNAERLPNVYGGRSRFDNVDVYRFAYETLFGPKLDYPFGQRAPTRPAGAAPKGTRARR